MPLLQFFFFFLLHRKINSSDPTCPSCRLPLEAGDGEEWELTSRPTMDELQREINRIQARVHAMISGAPLVAAVPPLP
jgi:hypothetical protein